MQGDAVKTVLFLYPSWLLYLLIIETENIKTLTLIENTVKVAKGDMCVQSLIVSNSVGHGLQHNRLPCPLLSPGVCLNPCPLSWLCYLSIPSSVIPFSCLQSFPASGSFPVSQFFPSGSQSTGASASVLPMDIQDWFPLGLTSWISLQSKGFSRVFSSTTDQKHQFFSTQLSL